MPIYEYVCQDCKEHIEVMRPMKDADAPLECQNCHGDHLSRMLSRFNASSGGRVIASSSGCGSCSGGSCSGCGHQH